MNLKTFREAFSLRPELVHLNNAGLCLTSKPARDAIHHWTDRFHQEAMHCNDEYLAALEEARAHFGRFIHAPASQIAFFQSTAGAISQVALGMKLQPDDEVVVWDQEFPSNLHPWRVACERAGAHLRVAVSPADLSTPPEIMQRLVTERTRVIAISWVQYQAGALTDLQQLVAFAKPRGIWVVVDVIQGLGLRPFDFMASGVDAICGGSHKWMLTPVSAGFLALRPERISQLEPRAVGASSFEPNSNPQVANLKKTAARFEPGGKQVLEIIGLGASAKFLSGFDLSILQAEAERLGDMLAEGLSVQGLHLYQPSLRARNFINFSAHEPGRLAEIAERLKKSRISFALRGPGLRLSTHAFNTEADVQKTLLAVRG